MTHLERIHAHYKDRPTHPVREAIILKTYECKPAGKETPLHNATNTVFIVQPSTEARMQETSAEYQNISSNVCTKYVQIEFTYRIVLYGVSLLCSKGDFLPVFP